MRDYQTIESRRESRFKQIGRECFFWLCVLAGAGLCIAGLYMTFALLYVVVPS